MRNEMASNKKNKASRRNTRAYTKSLMSFEKVVHSCSADKIEHSTKFPEKYPCKH